MAAPSAADFQTKFPEFSEVDTGLIDEKIAEAVTLLSEDAFGVDLHTLAVHYKAAHLLALSPYGQQLQLVNGDGETVYGTYYKQQILPRVARRGAVL